MLWGNWDTTPENVVQPSGVSAAEALNNRSGTAHIPPTASQGNGGQG